VSAHPSFRAAVTTLTITATLVVGFAVATPAVAVGRVSVADLRPPIVSRSIPFGETRRRQMGAYSKRHYGRWAWRLRVPRAIVEHYTDGTSFSGAWNTFASNTSHLGELPGTCAHFVIDTDGTIYQLVPLWVRCRHTIGLNQTAIGIEHVGTGDRAVLGNERMMRASLRLTTWLAARFEIEARNVIGHGESLMSPLRRERYPSWRCLTHVDMAHRAMRTYRGWLRDRYRAAGIPVGPKPAWIDLGC
jgi:beta-N-acetylhexosaminidase